MPRTLLAIGETMAMVAPVIAAPVADADDFLLDAGGAESNVAAHVSALGHTAVWFSRLGADALGRRIARQLTSRGVDVSRVVYDDTRRTGLYVKDPGNGVLYYRDGSAASALCELDAD
ncbi:MAG TPA: PfkB family carbohydrate kinase, partial [Microbacterium sp.]|nr:PfkB family carbohydrate kinase [Microbacterium sp.]